MKKRMRIMIIGLVIVFGGILGFNLFKTYMIKKFFASYQPPAVSVSSITAKSINWDPSLDAIGDFVAIDGVEISSEASGNVVGIHFKSGQFIEKDNLLIDIDDSINQATLLYNESDLTLQKLNYKRQTDLYKKGATPSSSVDEARARLMQSEANVQKTQAEISQKHLKAPFTGRLGIRQVNLGQYITPGQTNIVTLQSIDPLHLNFYLPEQLLNKINIGQTINFSVEQSPGLIFQGKINAINSKVDTKTHNIEVQATLPNCPTKDLKNPKNSQLIKVTKQPLGNKLVIKCDTELNAKNKIVEFNFVPGMFAAIEVEQPSISNAIIVPTTAISFSLYGSSVFVIQKGIDENKEETLTVKRVFVKTGDVKGNYTVITSGIKAGQEIVSSGELKLQNDTRVTINNSVVLNESPNISKLGQ